MATKKSKAAKMVNELLESSSPKAKKKAPARTRGAEKAEKTAMPAAETAAAITPEKSNLYVVIDYPTEGEVISGLHYAIRVGASEQGRIELSFNGGDWQQARQGAGYWWFDWGYFEPGAYKIVARLTDDNGRLIKKSETRKVQVV